MMECFAKTINGFQSISIFATLSILDAWQGFEYASLQICFSLMESTLIVFLICFIYLILFSSLLSYWRMTERKCCPLLFCFNLTTWSLFFIKFSAKLTFQAYDQITFLRKNKSWSKVHFYGGQSRHYQINLLYEQDYACNHWVIMK